MLSSTIILLITIVIDHWMIGKKYSITVLNPPISIPYCSIIALIATILITWHLTKNLILLKKITIVLSLIFTFLLTIALKQLFANSSNDTYNPTLAISLALIIFILFIIQLITNPQKTEKLDKVIAEVAAAISLAIATITALKYTIKVNLLSLNSNITENFELSDAEISILYWVVVLPLIISITTKIRIALDEYNDEKRNKQKENEPILELTEAVTNHLKKNSHLKHYEKFYISLCMEFIEEKIKHFNKNK